MTTPTQFPDLEDTTLPDAAEAAMNILEESYADLAVLRQRDSSDPSDKAAVGGEENEQQSSSRELAARVAARMEACAAALRKAADSETSRN